MFELGQDTVKTNILTKFHKIPVTHMACSVNKNFLRFDLVTYLLIQYDPY